MFSRSEWGYQQIGFDYGDDREPVAVTAPDIRPDVPELRCGLDDIPDASPLRPSTGHIGGAALVGEGDGNYIGGAALVGEGDGNYIARRHNRLSPPTVADEVPVGYVRVDLKGALTAPVNTPTTRACEARIRQRPARARERRSHRRQRTARAVSGADPPGGDGDPHHLGPRRAGARR